MAPAWPLHFMLLSPPVSLLQANPGLLCSLPAVVPLALPLLAAFLPLLLPLAPLFMFRLLGVAILLLLLWAACRDAVLICRNLNTSSW